MAFTSLTTLFVVPPSNTIPTTGSTQDLAAKQLGVFDNAYAPVTAGNAASKPYIYIAQGRVVAAEGMGSKRSDRIYAKNILSWYKVVAEPQIPSQITELSGFNIKCEEDLTITFRLFSSYINVSYYNGLTKSVWVKAPCCDCGGDPCDTVDAAGTQAIVDEFVSKINADKDLSRFLIALRIGTGASSVLRVYGKALDKYGNPCDPTAFSFEYDRLIFYTYAHKGPINTQDLEVEDACDPFVDSIQVVQRAQYGRGSSDEIAQLEKNFYSYQAKYKHIFQMTGFNPEFQSEVIDGTYYDTYYLKFKEPVDNSWESSSLQDETVIIAVPTGQGSGLEAILVAFAGAVTDMSATDRTTTSTTSTTSSSTTSTTSTIIFP
jgi:hypothetical protein